MGSKCCLWVSGLLHPCVQPRLLTETRICAPTRSLGSTEVTSQGLKQVSLPMLTSSPAPSPLVLLCAHFTNGCITLQLPKPGTWRSGSPLLISHVWSSPDPQRQLFLYLHSLHLGSRHRFLDHRSNLPTGLVPSRLSLFQSVTRVTFLKRRFEHFKLHLKSSRPPLHFLV